MTQCEVDSEARPIAVLLVCGVRLYCDAIARLLADASHVRLCGSTIPNEEIVAAYDAASPDVVMLDAGGENALPFALKLIRVRPRARILGFGVHDLPAKVVACAQAGMSGYVANSASLQELVAATCRIATGETVCSAAMAEGLFRHLRGASAELQTSAVETLLTRRQQQVVRLLGDGYSNKEIARRLSIGASTVKNHVHEVLRRMEVSRRQQIAPYLRRSGGDQVQFPHVPSPPRP